MNGRWASISLLYFFCFFEEIQHFLFIKVPKTNFETVIKYFQWMNLSNLFQLSNLWLIFLFYSRTKCIKIVWNMEIHVQLIIWSDKKTSVILKMMNDLVSLGCRLCVWHGKPKFRFGQCDFNWSVCVWQMFIECAGIPTFRTLTFNGAHIFIRQ